ncbi:MAG: hypothetical protein JWO73_704 [Candidatus Taylorbacteria bacterium]|nr:hypothetical protein [Candidatus Taylorbacteria bacterium]
MNMKTKIVVGMVVLAAAAFYAGNAYGKNGTAAQAQSGAQNSAAGAAFGNRNGGTRGAGSGMNMRGNLITGSVISKDDKSITISLREGGSKIVFFGANTAIMKTATGTVDDIQTNTQVMVSGSANSDGSVTAQSIQLRPASRPDTASSTGR